MDVVRTDIHLRARRRRWWWGVAGAVIVGLPLGLANFKPAVPTVARANLSVDSVRKGDFLRTVRGSGSLVPRESRWLTTESSARVDRVLLKPGAMVSADSVILELTDPQVDNSLATASAAVAEAEAELAAKQTELRSKLLDQRAALARSVADVEISRARVAAEEAAGDVVPRLDYRKDVITLNQLEEIASIERERVSEYERNISHQLAAQQARVDQMIALRQLRQRQKEALRVRAGIDGVLEQVAVEDGQQVAEGTNVARVAKVGEFIAKLRVPETQAKDVAIGQRATVDLRSVILEGQVIRVDPAIREGTVDVDVALVGDLSSHARSDLSIDGTIEIQRVINVLYVGLPALTQVQSDANVFRVDADGGASLQKVKFGRGSTDKVEVLAGLREGDQIIVSDMSNYVGNERLRLR